MGSFFHGWRRKVGIALLLAAVGIFGLWMRSHMRFDRIAIDVGESTHELKSEYGQLCWSRSPQRTRPFTIYWSSGRASEFRSVEFWHNGTRWQWPKDGSGFRFANAESAAYLSRDGVTKIHCEFWVIPHAAVVLPMTLLSAYFIVRKPRKRAPD